MKFLQKMFGAKIVRIALSCSLLLAVAPAFGQPYTDAYRKFRDTESHGVQLRILNELHEAKDLDPLFADKISEFKGSSGTRRSELKTEILNGLRVFAKVEKRPPFRSNHSIKDQAIKEKKNPLYKNYVEQDQSNWLEKSGNNFGEFISRIIGNRPARELPNGNPPQMPFSPSAFLFILYSILALLAIGIAYLILRHVSWKKRLKVNRASLVEDEEEGVTLDEWLKRADEFAAAGRYREAIRALYLACLLRFDQHGIARFVRGQTNWEHLTRIMASPKLPAGFDFGPATQLFDRAWYGFRDKGMIDVEQMRSWYLQVNEAKLEAAS